MEREGINAKSNAKRFILGSVLLMTSTFIAYLPATKAQFVWDDNRYLTENRALQSPHALRLIWFKPAATIQYYPMIFTSFWIERRLWGLKPFGYHFDNILLHAVNSLLLWILLRRWNVAGAWLAAMIFALNPVNVESVAWISERKNVLSGIFFFLTFLAWDRFVERKKKSDYTATILLFVCALLSKASTCPLPIVLLLILWWRRKTFSRAYSISTIPLFVLGLFMGIAHAVMEKKNLVGNPAEYQRSFVARLLVAGRAAWFYIGKILLPTPLMTLYPRWEIHAAELMPWVFLFMSVAVPALLFFQRKRFGDKPLMAAIYYAAMIAPALGFSTEAFFRLSFVADHFQYLASVGLIAFVTATVAKATEQFRVTRAPVGVVAAAILLFTLGAMTWAQSQTYYDAEKLWRHSISKNPQTAFAHHALGTALAEKRELDEAIEAYTEAVRLKPDFPEARHNLGEVLQKKGRTNEAIEQYREVLRVKPGAFKTRVSLGIALGKIGKLGESAEEFRAAIQLEPREAPPHNLLGIALAKMGRMEEAKEEFSRALEIQPAFDDARANLDRAQRILRAGGNEVK